MYDDWSPVRRPIPRTCIWCGAVIAPGDEARHKKVMGKDAPCKAELVKAALAALAEKGR